MWASRPSRTSIATPVECHSCGRLKIVMLESGKTPGALCRSCASANRVGDSNPNWRGGHSHWSPGRFGRDKDGLSWKTQRNLAWERDNFSCRHCDKPRRRNPDVHHISPFRVSQSHALENLICLCQSCHLTEEAKVQEVWGGQALRPREQAKSRPTCDSCGHKRKLRGGVCWTCLTLSRQEEAVKLRDQGLTLRAIAKEMKLPNHQMVMRLLAFRISDEVRYG